MSNRDVILQISIAAIFCISIVSHAHDSLAEGRIAGESDTCYTNTNETYDSYENYLPAAKRNTATRSGIKQKKVINQKRPVQSIKHSSVKNYKRKTNTRYTVRKGDTLTSIAKKNNVTISSLQSLNKLSNQNRLKKGMILKIPSRQASPALSGNAEKKSAQTAPLPGSPKFQWPIKNIIDYRNDGLNGVKSIGIIITGKPGSTVLSSASGKVRKIGRMRGFGNYVVITHSGRYSTVYSNLDMILVSPGDTVPGGNAIGRMSSTEQKIHFQIDREGKPEDPLQYLPKKS
ncbi:MAG TPA: peptidoglycan DD-metalloendopeptidase family protein [Spirochaetota bacterium]|nr:peptidoglycan DD-metalloendopeptidase family protein [Spirochaetota bacterium]HPC39435.1 peptidoglycan DD-metalloendopeptidase family protein [Spirochaetota bacterium]HPL15901.1 peptidoglycan DD-metalloendopeptidase family protein [Spirochaetota bacterium]HQF06772.1 peptidoglycan DD-metalloendopeptidase family protein [Spirochaetota bacterium]HQH95609.1 peptidoglycan DD-metalloendopeptidase family protein [Spirochaetota bacterium]